MSFPPEVVVEVKALACELPFTLGLPLSRLHIPDIRAEVLRRGIVATVSDATIWRWLSEDAIRPWAHRSWISPRDPHFEARAGRVLDLYGRRWESKALHPAEFVISADEKTSIQARCRCHPTLPAAASRAMRVEHEYERGGALQYLAAWDCHRAKVFGRCEPRTGIEPFGCLVARVMTSEPYASARRVFWVVDNGSSHRGRAAVVRLEDRWPNLRLVHLPVLAEPSRNLLLRRPAQGPHPERLLRSRGGRATPPRLRAPLRGGGPPVRVEVHSQGPGSAHAEASREAEAAGRRLITRIRYRTYEPEH